MTLSEFAERHGYICLLNSIKRGLWEFAKISPRQGVSDVMIVVHTVAGLTPSSGGPSRTVPELCSALAAERVNVELLTLDYAGKLGRGTAPLPGSVKTTIVRCWESSKLRISWAPNFKRSLQDACTGGNSCLIHGYGLWLRTNHAAPSVAWEMKLPLVLSTRGMPTSWLAQFKTRKRRLAWLD